MVAWVVEHAAETLSKFEVGVHGKSWYERMKGKPCCHEIVKFGEQKVNQWRPNEEVNLAGKRREGIFLEVQGRRSIGCGDGRRG